MTPGEVKTVEAFWCAPCEALQRSDKEGDTCATCNKKMTTVGWFEFAP